MLENLKLKKDIVTLGILKAANKKVAFIKGNRMVQEKNVNAKWASLREYGQIVPAIMVNGEDVQVAGIRPETGWPIHEQAEAVVRHRGGPHPRLLKKPGMTCG